jgi:hypothetical protein
MIKRACALLTLVCFFAPFSSGQDWWNLVLWGCNPNSCYDFAVGIGQLRMTTEGTCGGGFSLGAASSVVSSCPNRLIDVSGFTAQKLTWILTAQGWVQRWIDGIGADASGVTGANEWYMEDEQFCDNYRYTSIPPMVPCG